MKKGIAFFDFDGTITTKDSFLEFISFAKGNFRFLLGFLLHAPWIVGFKLKIISNQQAKEKVMQYFFKNANASEFKELCAEFNNKVLPKLIRPKAVEEIRRLKAADYVVVIVSASPENWIRPFAESMDVELIASRLEVKDHKITGKIIGMNCRGIEKVNRIKERYDISAFSEIYAFGDSSGDKDMLGMATNAFYKPFRR